MNNRSFVTSALIAGVAIGLLAHLPVLNLINCFLCLWVWVGGFLAVFLYQRSQPVGSGLTGAQGAGLGALSGLIGVFIGIIVNALTSFISFPLFASLARFFQVEGDLPFQTVDLPSIVSSTVIFFILDVVTFPLFGAISGFIAASLMKKQQPA
jgi:hypothetical protein